MHVTEAAFKFGFSEVAFKINSDFSSRSELPGPRVKLAEGESWITFQIPNTSQGHSDRLIHHPREMERGQHVSLQKLVASPRLTQQRAGGCDVKCIMKLTKSRGPWDRAGLASETSCILLGYRQEEALSA